MSFPIGGILLDGLVLSVLSQGDAYGYSLTQDLQKAAQISESTLYPVLRRLQKDQYLETYDSPYAGRNRRYYKLTAEGHSKLTHIREEWVGFEEKISQLLLGEGGNQDE
ncbi:MAG: PadR family transcriptional regulator [Oscillospiraceae bacterium]|nr:PadR family transcriptional regulator [Oscillospiraceae bacterium]